MRLLIVGSLNGQIGTASKIAISRGATVAHADDIDGALKALRSGQGADLVMVDDKLDIARIINSLKSERIGVPVVACGLGDDTKAAVGAIKSGAQEYIPLPPDPDLIAAVLEAVTEESSSIVFIDPAMAETLRLVEQVAATNASVLVTGESGTGKELIARHLHAKSSRAKKKFISINCAAIPDNLLESELFGHEKGSFTGAVARRIGKFEEANGGTLLLDEISEMDARLQAKLLRAIQERAIDRVGGTAPIPVDIRIIATSNRNLEKAISDGSFREDLYFRLNVVNLSIPPLRDRPEDINVLANYFIEKYAELNGVLARPLSAAGREKLRAHHWRGNVRELENAMHRAVLLATGEEIAPEAIVLSFSDGTTASEPTSVGSDMVAPGVPDDAIAQVGRTVAEVEREHILETLHHCFGNRTHAANILGISIRTLRNKLKLYSQDGASVPLRHELDRAAV
jgi:DNA-binding NtrC family response regulator